MSDQEINAAIEKLAFKHQLAVEHLTESQLADAIRQAILCVDFQRRISTDNGQSVTYKPFRKLKDAERERDEAREALAAAKDKIKELEGQVSYARHERNKALNETDEYKATFDVRWQAQMRAVTRWQEETGKKEFWPGHEDLCLWLLRKLEAAK